MHNVRNRLTPNVKLRLDPSVVWEDRKSLVKREVETQRVAADANTARLRALRLEKEAAEKSAGDSPAPKPIMRKRRSAIKA